MWSSVEFDNSNNMIEKTDVSQWRAILKEVYESNKLVNGDDFVTECKTRAPNWRIFGNARSIKKALTEFQKHDIEASFNAPRPKRFQHQVSNAVLNTATADTQAKNNLIKLPRDIPPPLKLSMVPKGPKIPNLVPAKRILRERTKDNQPKRQASSKNDHVSNYMNCNFHSQKKALNRL